jgi:hypothetical protein
VIVTFLALAEKLRFKETVLLNETLLNGTVPKLQVLEQFLWI